ncbi:MAG: ATP-binding cassette domain-containing protein [Methylovulum sp.]|nr:ATP-binding cassette domain-containing protein [Methylovulum sp.]
MSELLLRLGAYRLLTVELVLASFFVNLLSLASSIYVIQIFNRYISYGVDATLFTLTTGVCLALFFEFSFQRVRLNLAELVGKERNQQLISSTFNNLTRIKASALQRLSFFQRQEIIQSPDIIAEAYCAANLTTILDVPFIVLFLIALFFISPLLGLITIFFIAGLFIFSIINQRHLRSNLSTLNELSNKTKNISHIVNQDIDTIRLFEQNQNTRKLFEQKSKDLQLIKAKIASLQNLTQTIMKSAQALLGIAIYATGANLAVHGELDIGMLIGANILALRTLSPITRFVQLGEIFAKAEQALERLQRFALLETERDGGSALTNFSGSVIFKDVAFTYTDAHTPIFESLNLEIPAGTVLVVTGGNSSGKTTLVRLIAGLLEPTRGQILVDGLILQQLAPNWWRSQLCYLPQNANFLPGTIRDNLLNTNARLDDAQLNTLITEAEFAEFIDKSPDGINTLIINNGDQLTFGQRRRFALVRALASYGKLVLFDEPTEGLDKKGCHAIYKLLINLSREGRTLVVFSQDPQIIQGAPLILDLDIKPAPRLVHNNPVAKQ